MIFVCMSFYCLVHSDSKISSISILYACLCVSLCNSDPSQQMAFLSLVAIFSARAATPPVWKGLHVDPWGKNALRVRFSLTDNPPYNGPGALSAQAPSMFGVETYTSPSRWSSGDLSLSLDQDTLTLARGNETLAEISLAFSEKTAGGQKNVTTLTVATASTSSDPTSYFGFGEHENSKLDQVLPIKKK